MVTENKPFISVENVSMRFGDVEAVHAVTLSVDEGTIFGLVGSDGAGKSTLLRMVATMMPPVSGNILIGTLDVVSNKRQVKPLIGYMPQRFGLYQDLTVDENMQFFMDVFNVPKRERAQRRKKYLGFSNLLPFVDRPAGNLSGGMKQKLGLACVLVHEPKALILDEPTNGVDPVSRQEFWEILAQMRADGMTIMVSTAYLDEADRCARVGLIHKGKLLRCDLPVNIKKEMSADSMEQAFIKIISEYEHGKV